MLSLHTNAAALSAQNSIGGTQKSLATSMSRLSTGYRVNSAMDDAAGLQIATRLNAQTRGMAVAMRNTPNGISMLQTAEGALSETTNILLRMKDLATEAASDTASADDRTAIKSELDALNSELDNIFKNTSFGGRALFTSAVTGEALSAATTFQIGASTAETMTLSGVTVPTGFALDPADVDVSNHTNANALIGDLQDQIDALGTFRSQLGAVANRLEHTYNNLANMSTNTEAARGRIMDVDYASETAQMTKQQMLLQAGTSMLRHSGSMSQLVLSLMQ